MRSFDEHVVHYEVAEGVATLTLNRPDRLNAWTIEMGAQYEQRIFQAAADPDVRAIVVTGAGRGFCAGADMSLVEAVANGAQVDLRLHHQPTRAIEVPKPVIAAINGSCAGMGLAVALSCDVRFVAAGAKLTSSFVRRGLIAEYLTAWTLPRVAGIAIAMDVLLSGRVFLAEEALQMGIVNRVLPSEDVLSEAIAYARDLAHNCSPRSMAVIKRQVLRLQELSVSAAVENTIELMDEALRSPDIAEGVRSFTEKRPPRFAPLETGQA